MNIRLSLALALLSLNTACNAEPQATAPVAPVLSTAGLPIVPLTIEHDGKKSAFRVEVARTSDEQAKGLMFRDTLPGDEGMIFPFPSPRMASFWMKNTFIPLDIIFIRADGTIANIAENTTPQSLEPVGSIEPVAAVLELAGGRARTLGIEAGDKVRW
ncbi:DUF192 domain-containing protein [Allosphingosinicella vermicomposti]|uniref:DUF192 domain-containing protein n=1 Tax=Allosphingosinicella vermicomposti TaxID=614671 RepID=UPI000D10648E|nr:DUF192 domain-containing protein [Allosphingosinicella vermicomposti]